MEALELACKFALSVPGGFQYGVMDCCQFVRMYLGFLGKDITLVPVDESLIRMPFDYTDERGANRIIGAYGGTLVGLFTSQVLLGNSTYVSPLLRKLIHWKASGPSGDLPIPQPGSVVVALEDKRMIAGVLNYSYVLAYTEEGITLLPKDSILAAWEPRDLLTGVAH